MKERRRSQRLSVGPEISGRVKATLPVRLVDLSSHGAQIESDTGLPPAGEIDLAVAGPVGELRARAAVRRCRAQAGPKGLVFRAGVEFLNPSPEFLERLRRTLEHLGGEGFVVGFETPRPAAEAADPVLRELEDLIRKTG